MNDLPGIFHILLALRFAGGEMFYVEQTTNYIGLSACTLRSQELTAIHGDDVRFKAISCKQGMVIVVEKGAR